MSPQSTTLPPPPKGTSEDALEAIARRSKAPIVNVPPRLQVGSPTHQKTLFSEALLEMSDTRPKTRALALSLSVVFQVLFLAILILIPLFFTEAIDLKQFTQTMLVAPPPPPPPPPPAAVIQKVMTAPKRVFTSAGKLLAPTAIPAKIAMIKEEEIPPDVGVGVAGGVPGGVPGGQMGGVMGGIISGGPKTMIPALPVPPAATPKAPVRVGGRIREPRLITRVEPVYPSLARQARIQGDVVIDAIIDVNGNVQEMQVVSGHMLLVPAAIEALKRWKYEPTYLNDEPVPVQLLVTLRFRLQ
jgi:protein TonB